MNRKQTGTYATTSVTGEKVNAFIPAPLPPKPPLEWSTELRLIYERALTALGRLDGISISKILPSSELFIYTYVRKEAVLSSQIEGTQSTLADLFSWEAGGEISVEFDDLKEVSNYVKAMEHGLKRVRADFPISNRLIKEIHQILLSGNRGSSKNPGEFRTSQNWIGGSRPGNARYVPPPPQAVVDCMSALEKFIHDQPEPCPTLVKAALAHAQFETIHPFLDGNGRAGRLLITLLLCAEGVLSEPLLYLSLYLKENRDRYYDLLQNIRLSGDWEEWLTFFFTGVEQTANNAVSTAQALLKLVAQDRKKIEQLGRSVPSALQIHGLFQQHPICSVKFIAQHLKLTPVTINKILSQFEQLTIVKEITGKKRDRLFAYEDYLSELSRGTAPLKKSN